MSEVKVEKPKKARRNAPATIQTYKNKVLWGLKLTFDGPSGDIADATKRVKDMWLVVYGEKLDLRYKANWKKIAESDLTQLRIKYAQSKYTVVTKAEQIMLDAEAIRERQAKRNHFQHRQLSVVS